MLRKLFAARPLSRPSPAARSCPPQLEALEDRLAPAPVGQLPPPPPSYPSNQPPFGPSATPTTISNGVPGFQGVFPTTSIGPFGLFPGSFALVALEGGALGGSQAAPQGVGGGNGGAANSLAPLQQLAVNLYQLAAQQNVQQANSLVIDEFFQATDAFVLSSAQNMGLSNPGLQADISAHQTAVGQNPLSQSLVGQVLGPLVYDLTLYLYVSGQGAPPAGGVG